MTHQLSKSTYMRGVKCPKSLYLNKHGKQFRDEMSLGQEAVFAQGHQVEDLAIQLFPGGIDLTPASHYDYGPSIFRTKQAIAKGEAVIYEAAFLYNGVLCAMDVLVKSKNGYKAFEIKSSTQVHPQYIDDTALQYHLISNCGVVLEDISIVHVNNQYVRQGALEIEKLFTIQSVKTEVEALQEEVEANIAEFKKVLQNKEVPAIEVGGQCGVPYPCDFSKHCWGDIPAYSIFNISRISEQKRMHLYGEGILDIKDVPDDFELSDNQRLQVNSEKNKSEIVDQPQLSQFLYELNYPIYHLDFETINPAIPPYDGCRPFQQTVFQYSLHLQESPGSDTTHFEYLAAMDDADPRIDFVERLIAECGSSGDILVYNIGFEKGRLQELAALFPDEAAQINGLISRLKDLMIPFAQKWFYSYKQQGSASLKKVLPAIAPDYENAYSGLTISDGGTASIVFAQMLSGTFQGDMEQARQDLLEYCKLDTLAMVVILERLYGLVE